MTIGSCWSDGSEDGGMVSEGGGGVSNDGVGVSDDGGCDTVCRKT